MTTPKENKKIERFIHEEIHEIAKDEETMNLIRDFIATIIDKWEKFKEEYIEEG